MKRGIAMGFSTRSYAGPYVMGGGLPPGVKMLLIANVAMFLLTWLAGNGSLGFTIQQLLALTPSAVVTQFYVWQVVTYLFLHASFFHILFNMLGLWFFGGDLERAWGTERFLNFYFFSGVGAGLMVVLFNYLAGTPNIATVGASGAIYGIFLVAAVMWPDRIIIFYIFPIKLKYFVMILAAIAFFGLREAGSGVSHIGHLSGMAFGYLYYRWFRGRARRRPAYATAGGSSDLFGALNEKYRQWKLQRAKKKFQVYLRKHGSDRDPWVH